MVKKGERTNRIQTARIARTRFFFDDRNSYLVFLEKEIRKAIVREKKKGFVASFRLNGTSDIAWEEIGVPQKFPGSQFYDYTKNPERYAAFLNGDLPANYHLTFSRSEENADIAEEFVRQGGNATIVFYPEIPAEYRGLPVFNGDNSDFRPADPSGHWIGLKFKGRIFRRNNAIESGFCVSV